MKEIKYKDLINYDLTHQYGTIALAQNEKEINGLQIGWCQYGIVWSKPTASVYIREDRYSKHIFDTSRFFSINYFNENYSKEVEYYGTVSGKDENKIENGGLKVVYSEEGIPYFKEASIVIFCELLGYNAFDINKVFIEERVEGYKKTGPHSEYIGEVIKVLKQEK